MLNKIKRLLKKSFTSLKRDGIFKTAKKVFRYIKWKLLTNKSQVLNIINETVDIKKFATVIIFENNFGWNKIMKQRPQQIAENLPDDTLIFYHSHEDSDFKGKNRVTKLKDNLIVIDIGYFRDELFEALAAHNNKYLMIYSTDFIPYDRVKMYNDFGYEIIYEYVDDINAELSGEEMFKTLSERHEQILKMPSSIICTATELYNKLDNETKQKAMLISNGVDYKHFESKEYDLPDDLKPIRQKYEKLICYYGALASWFDYELINKIALNKEIGIVLLGQDYDGTLKESKILDNENVFYLGKKSYDELPKYGYNIDVFTIPFVINDITEATSPVKLFEYMAMQKPIITTALPECKKYKSVIWCQNHKEYINNLDLAFSLVNNEDYKKLLVKEAKENTWDSKAENLIKFVNQQHYSNIQSEIEKIINDNNYERIIVWRSPFGWDVPLFQRPQHIANNLANKNCLVFYEVSPKTDFVKTIKKQKKNLYLINLENYLFKKILHDQLSMIDKPKYVQIYSTNWSMDISELKEYQNSNFRVLYEYIDDISPDLAGTDEIPPYIIDKYNYAMENKDILIVTTANELYEDVKAKRGTENLAFSCNGVDYNFFQDLDKDYKFEKSITKILENRKINLCYYGALASWFDYELIRKIDKTDKYNIVLFGIKYDNSYDESNIDALDNVYFMGPRDYAVLKNYASKMDILTIPFVINSITQATSPLKLFEYMALKKPIITTAMNECKNYKSVLVGENHEDFIEKLEQCVALKLDKSYINLLEKEAMENDWSHKTDIIIDLLKENEKI